MCNMNKVDLTRRVSRGSLKGSLEGGSQEPYLYDAAPAGAPPRRQRRRRRRPFQQGGRVGVRDHSAPATPAAPGRRREDLRVSSVSSSVSSCCVSVWVRHDRHHHGGGVDPGERILNSGSGSKGHSGVGVGSGRVRLASPKRSKNAPKRSKTLQKRVLKDKIYNLYK